MSKTESQEISSEDVAPMSAIVTALPFNVAGGAAGHDATFVSGHALAMLANNLPPIVWTFDENQKAYFGAAPYGAFELRREESGRLYAQFISNCETHTSRMNLNEDKIGNAKAAILPRLLDSLNQSRRLELVFPKEMAEAPVFADEPDLI